MKRLIFLLAFLVLALGLACGEQSISAEIPELLENMVLDHITISLDTNWVIESNDGDNKAIQGIAVTIDNECVLTVFQSGEGDDAQNAEIAAINEYSSGIMREATEQINGITMIFATNEEANSVCSYFSAKGFLYTVSITCHSGNMEIKKMREMLHQIMETVTINL